MRAERARRKAVQEDHQRLLAKFQRVCRALEHGVPDKVALLEEVDPTGLVRSGVLL